MALNTYKSEYLIIFLLSFFLLTSCNKNDDDVPDEQPQMTGITISGGGKVFNAVIYFNVGVYKNSNKTGDLDEQSFRVKLTGGKAGLASYLVNHVAGQKNANIRITLDQEADLKEILTIRPFNNEAIYNAYGSSMDTDVQEAIGLDGITHDIISITDDGNGTGTTTFTSNNTYILNGFVFVNDGQTLTIESGTVIKGNTGQGEDASALIVARGGTIIANGSPSQPIIFTSVLDDLNGSVSDFEDGLWGGVIILGHAKLNSLSGEQKIEGIPENESRAVYGGQNDNDNSGILRYISIRHGGTDIGYGSEINGLTLGGVGSETIIEFIEVFANKDDGVEIFGGAPKLNNILVAFCGDDAFDYDDGFRGRGQFWVGVQGFNRGDLLGEHDGCSNTDCIDLFSNPHIYNTTYIGRSSGTEKSLITFRGNSGGQYANSIFYQMDALISIEYLTSESSFDQFLDGNLMINNNIFYQANSPEVIAVFPGTGITNEQEEEANITLADYFVNAANEIKDPGFTIGGLTFDIIPKNAVTGNLANYPDDNWFRVVNYKGAFNPSAPGNWAEGWTLFSNYMN